MCEIHKKKEQHTGKKEGEVKHTKEKGNSHKKKKKKKKKNTKCKTKSSNTEKQKPTHKKKSIKSEEGEEKQFVKKSQNTV